MTEIIGKSKPILDMLKLIEKVAKSKSSILIVGESGTGKELVARMIHERGELKTKPFVAVNCGAIPENLIESELFGHKKGSFTGAVVDKVGLFEVANGGTMFLDEIGELPLGMQVKLLRVLQEQNFRRVGGNENIRVEVRIIAATNRDLELGIKENKFREDLYYRLNVIQIKTPPLRLRPGDTEILAGHFLSKYAKKQGKRFKGFESETMAALRQYSWPGNVRELENVIERAVTFSGIDGETVPPQALPPHLAQFALNRSTKEGFQERSKDRRAKAGMFTLPEARFDRGALNLDEILGEVEKLYLLAALDHTQGVKKKAADLLGITFRSMRYRLKKLGVDSGPDDEDES